jgi:RND superfamily putative drug exporter
VLLPQLLEQYPPMIATMEQMRTMMLTMHSTMSGILSETDDIGQTATEMGQTFDAAKNDDSFYLPPEVFQNADFQRAMNSFLSPDGKAARFIISHRGDPATPEGVARIDRIRTAAEEALKTTPLRDAKIYIAHAKFCGRPGYRGDGGAFAGRIVWALRAHLAVYSGHQIALDGASDVGDHSVGGGV